jgi:putative sterol carrier protein
MSENTYKIRTFIEGDENSIVQLFNSTFQEYAGFVPRTPEYWNWCCLQRPDVAKEGIFIATQNERIVGYAVAGKSGNIWEMSYDKTCDGEIIVTKIIGRVMDYLESEKADSILINFPTDDKIVRKVCNKLNFAESPPEYMFISVLDFPLFFDEVVRSLDNKEKLSGKFLFKLKNLPASFNNSFCIDIGNKEVTITEKAVQNPEVTIDIDASTLLSIVLGDRGVLGATLTSKIRFYPFWKIGKVMRLFSMLQNKSPWFMPRADSG